MDTDQSPPRTRWRTAGIAALALVVGLVVGGLGNAAAEEGGTAPAVEAVPVPPPFSGVSPAPFPGPGPHDRLFFKRFGGPGIHSEATVENPEGKYETTATQVGKVVNVSPSSITLESDDGFKRTYTVTEDTLVTAGRDGIDNLEPGDTARLVAMVEGDRARAVQIWDAAAMKPAGGGVIRGTRPGP